MEYEVINQKMSCSKIHSNKYYTSTVDDTIIQDKYSDSKTTRSESSIIIEVKVLIICYWIIFEIISDKTHLWIM